jgi:hypothetical protein
MDAVERISGPVNTWDVEYLDYHITIYADTHNSLAGNCGSQCFSYDYNSNVSDSRRVSSSNVSDSRRVSSSNVSDSRRVSSNASDSRRVPSSNASDRMIPVGTDSTCMDLARFLHTQFQRTNKDIDFYLEYSYVLENSAKLTDPTHDTIDQLVHVFYPTLQVKKDHEYLPNVHVHYADIRDMYRGNQRYLVRANPFAERWLDEVADYQSYITCILDNAWSIYEMYTESTQPNINIHPVWNLYFNRAKLLSSKGEHRVAKQLNKLNAENCRRVKDWSHANFERVLAATTKRRWDWHPKSKTTLLVPLSSVIMDTYLLARLLYQGQNAVIVAGQAHTDSYLNFFSRHGAKITKHEASDMRCIIR